MSLKRFQEGGLIDEAELFSEEPSGEEGAEGAAQGSLSGELVDNADGDAPAEVQQSAQAPPPVNTEAPIDTPPVQPIDTDTGLNGVELFLSDFGVKGGMIEFEGGRSAHFSSLPATEQEEVLKSLTQGAIPSVEEKYNLDEDEITLLNAYRESGDPDIGNFLNNIVDERMSTYMQKEQELAVDYDGVQEDDLFIFHLKSSHPDFSDDQIADELVKAKDLITYSDTVSAIRDSYKSKQSMAIQQAKSAEGAEFNNEVEAQRTEIVSYVEDITDIAGAQINDEIKEYLLTDMMELNDNNDPILMEKIFSSPESMFKANWFLTYGEDYIGNLNDYWKKQVSAAYKKGYDTSINGMPNNPTIIGADIQRKSSGSSDQDSPGGFGQKVTEEELFD